jgi:hypothetical protein
MAVEGWLRSLGLEQYEAVFRENAIDETALPDLTDQDLEKLGVLLGHRRKLLHAIAELKTVEKGATVGAVAEYALHRCRKPFKETSVPHLYRLPTNSDFRAFRIFFGQY